MGAFCVLQEGVLNTHLRGAGMQEVEGRRVDGGSLPDPSILFIYMQDLGCALGFNIQSELTSSSDTPDLRLINV